MPKQEIFQTFIRFLMLLFYVDEAALLQGGEESFLSSAILMAGDGGAGFSIGLESRQRSGMH